MATPRTDAPGRVHDWHIDERKYLRHESRRGRRHAYVHLEPTRTALVVVDLVPFFVEESEFCRGIVPNVNALAGELRAAAARSRGWCPGIASRPDRLWPGLDVGLDAPSPMSVSSRRCATPAPAACG